MWAHLPCVAMAPLVNQNDKTARSYHLIVACTSCNHCEKLQFGKKKKKKYALSASSLHPQEFGKRVNFQLRFPPRTLWLFAEVCLSEQHRFWPLRNICPQEVFVQLQSIHREFARTSGEVKK